MGKERRSEEELRQMLLAAARQHEECSNLEDLFIFGPMPRRDANWGFGIAGRENKVSVACFKPVTFSRNMNCTRQGWSARYRSEGLVPVHDHPTLAASLSREGGAYEVATFKRLNGRPNWTMEWGTDEQSAKAAFDRIVRSVQTQIELE